MKVHPFLGLGALLLAVTSLGAADRFKKEFEVGSSPRLVVDADVAVIKVTQGPQGRIAAHVELPNKERYRLSSFEEGDTVHISLENKGLKGWLFSPFEVASDGGPRMSIEVPQNSGLVLSVEAGRVEVEDLEAAEMEVRTDAGAVRIKHVKGRLRINSGSGRVSVEHFQGTLDAGTDAGRVVIRDSQGSFLVSTGVGGIEVEDASGRFRMSADMGGIEFTGSFTEGDDNYLRSGLGSIHIGLCDADDIEIDAESDLGRVDIRPKPASLEESERRLKATIGAGRIKLTVRSDVGSISIRKTDCWTPAPSDASMEEVDEE